MTSQSAGLEAREASAIYTAWFERFASALTRSGAPGLGELLLPHAWWRDLVALNWRLASYTGTETIQAFVASAAQFPLRSVRSGGVEPILTSPTPEQTWVEGFFEGETEAGHVLGHVRLMPDVDGEWRAWTVLTSLDDLTNRPRAIRHRRPRPARGGEQTPWHHRRAEACSFERPDPEVLVVGAGQNGLAVAANLGLIGVDTLVVERDDQVGDVWRKRYESLVLHAPVYSDHLPYFAFPPGWPVYTPKEKYADWLDTYRAALEINVWTGTEVVSGEYDEQSHTWTVTARTPQGERVLHPRHLVVATGISGVPVVPTVPGRDTFGGQVLHTAEYRSGSGVAGKKAVVIGAGTSAHDVMEDLHHSGAEVTMVQRGGTYVMSRDNGNLVLFEGQYNEDSLPLEYADLQATSIPWPLLMQLAEPQTAAIAEMDRELLDGLRRTNFKVVMGEPTTGERSGLMSFGARSGGPGGYYIDCGASGLIIDGKVAVHQGAGLEEFTPTGVRLSDGTELEADIVVLATGFLDMREGARRYLGDEVVDRTAPLGGIDESGELGLLWQQSGQEGLWFIGGGLVQVRPYSKYLAFQIAADLDGILNTRAGDAL